MSPSKRRPILDTTRKLNDVQEQLVRVRVFATRSEYEVLIGEQEIDDPEAPVWCFPKSIPAVLCVDQAIANERNS